MLPENIDNKKKRVKMLMFHLLYIGSKLKLFHSRLPVS